MIHHGESLAQPFPKTNKLARRGAAAKSSAQERGANDPVITAARDSPARISINPRGRPPATLLIIFSRGATPTRQFGLSIPFPSAVLFPPPSPRPSGLARPRNFGFRDHFPSARRVMNLPGNLCANSAEVSVPGSYFFWGLRGTASR